MTPDETTRIFAERQGWKPTYSRCNDIECEECSSALGGHESESPNPTDRNAVHAALMGMSEGEWDRFCVLVRIKTESMPFTLVESVFKTSLSTLVSCYLEATNGRISTVQETKPK